MPYKRAYLWVSLVGLLTIPAFWRGYFSQLSTAPVEMHAHAVTATLWLVLLAAQAWAAQGRERLGLHRTLGRASLFFFPFFMASAMLIVWSMAYNTAFGDSIIYREHGEGLGAYDLVSVAAILWFYFEALKSRRQVHVHARFMIGTLFALLGPIFARLVAIPLFITLGDSFPPPSIFYAALVIAQVGAFFVALWLLRGIPLQGVRPMRWVVGLTVVQMAAFSLFRLSDGWREIFMAMGATPSWAWAALGFVLGVLVTWRGWEAGKANAPNPGAQPEPARQV